MRHEHQRALTVNPAPTRRGRPRKADLSPGFEPPTLFDDLLLRTGSKLPDRYWIKGANGLYSSVPRGSAAHRADRDLRGL